MCRLFAIRSRQPIAVRPAFDRLKAFAEEHKDGWGVATFQEGELRVELGTMSAASCERFNQWGDTLAEAMLVHIRLASVGTVHERNTHPFVAGPWVFMHNGTLKQFERVRHRFESEIHPAIRQELKGETDSERCFALFRTYLENRTGFDDVTQALQRTFQTAAAICDDGNDGVRSAMNFLVSDGTRLFATRRDRPLYIAAQEHLAAIGSAELLPFAPWRELPDDMMVTVDQNLALSVRPLVL